MRGGGAALAGPSLVWIAGVAAIVLLAIATGYRPFASPSDLTLSEAAALRDGLEITRLIRLGANPNARASVRRDIIRSTPLELTPLEAAVAIRRADVMALLVREGARIDVASYPVLQCLAEFQKAGEVIDYLEKAAPAAAPVDCSTVTLPW